jgi:hypothetical protein
MFSEMLESAIDTLSKVLDPNGPAQAATANSFTPTDFSVHFFLQLAIIMLTCRIVGKLGQKYLGQPQVVGEMIAGVILGPSLFGYFFADAQAAVFNMANPMAADCSGSIYTRNFAIKRDFVHGRLHRADRVSDVSAHY